MADINRKNTFLIKRSNVPGKVPLAGDLLLGELALNTSDVILYASGTTANSILPIGWDRVARTGDTMTGSLYAPTISATTISATTYLNLPLTTGEYLPLSGGTVSGNTNFTSGLTANTIYTNHIDFNTTATTTTQFGRINWDSGTGTLNIGVGDATTGLIDFQVGQEEVVRVFNSEATTLQKGEIVYVSGSQGNRPSVKRAIATNDGYSVTTLGVVASSISSGSEGYVTTFGIISNLNTSGLTGGTAIWLSPTVAGSFTETKPQAPYHTVLIGYVVRVSSTVGSIFVNISNGWELDELHDVRINNKQIGDLISLSAYNGSDVWVNTTTLNGSYTITGNTTVGGQVKANSVSATTYYNLPTDVYTTGGTPNNTTKTYTFTNNTGGTFTVNALTDIFTTGGTYDSGSSTITFTNNTGGTFTVTGITASGGGGTFTGGTVTGPTNFTSGLTANTVSATTYYGDGSNLTNIIATNPASTLFNYYNFI